MKRVAINYSKMRSANRSLERNLIGPNRLIERDSPVLPRLIDWFLKNPLELKILHFLLAACMWVVSDDQLISCPNELVNSFENTLKLSTQSLMTDWRASKRVKRHWMNFTSTFASLAFSFYNRVLSYAWNFYCSNSRKWHFLSKATSLASIFSCFIPHNMPNSTAWHINEKSCHKLLENEKCQ